MRGDRLVRCRDGVLDGSGSPALIGARRFASRVSSTPSRHVSHHLRVLREAGVVISERRGQWIWYDLDPAVADRLAAITRTLVPGGLITLTPRRTARPADTAPPVARA